MADNVGLSLNEESAQALREFADAMPVAVSNIMESTLKVIEVYQSVSEEVGPHREDFYNMLLMIKSAQEQAADAIEKIPPMLRKTADKIDHYLARKSGVLGN